MARGGAANRPAAPARRWEPALFGAFALALVLAQCWWRSKTVDVMFEDEVGYLAAGLSFFRTGPPRAENAPLYSLWYRLLAVAVRDPLALYSASWAALMLANLVGLGAALRALGVGWLGVSLGAAAASQLVLFEVWPYVSLASTALILVAVVLAVRCASRSWGLAGAAAILTAGAFVRPELAVSAGVTFAAAVVSAARERRFVPLAAPVATAALLVLTLGLPLGGGRSFEAFGQHYAFNVVAARKLQVDPWNNWQRLVEADFPGARSTTAALRTNPRAFAWHLGRNLTGLPAEATFPLRPLIRLGAEWLGIVLGLALCAAAGLGLWRARKEEAGPRLAVLAAAVALPTLASALLISPRSHYFLGLFAVLGVAAGLGVSRLRKWPDPPLPFRLVGLGVIVIAVLVQASNARKAPQPHRATVATLTSLALAAPATLLEADWGRGVLAGLEHQRLAPADCRPFRECLANRKVSVIASDERLRDAYRGDPGFRAFVAAPEGFQAVPVPGTRVVLYTRR